MSDLQLPSLSLADDPSAPGFVPTLPSLDDEDGGSSGDSRVSEGFRWPTPPFAAYPVAKEQIDHEPCEFEGLNGKLMRGRLVFFEPAELLAQVQVPPSRTTMPLRFSQFRLMLLTRPCVPSNAKQSADPHASMLEHRQTSEYRVVLKSGDMMQGETIGHVEMDFGLFLFPPLDEEGTVSRLFVPRDVFDSYELGPRIGEMLVANQAVTSDQVEQAVEVQQQMRSQKLGDILLTKHVVTPDQLLAAIDRQAKMPMVRIGEALTAMGLISPEQLAEALSQQQHDRSVPLGELLVGLGMVSRQDLQAALARKMGYPLVDVQKFPIESDALRKVPYNVASRLEALPLILRDSTLVVAVEDPSDRRILSEVEFVAQCKIVPVLALHGFISRTLQDAYNRIGADTSVPMFAKLPSQVVALDMEPEDSNALVASLEKEGVETVSLDEDKPIEQSDNSLVRLINTMIVEAHMQGVSDIHIESYPGREKIKIRFRKDGVLVPYLELPHNYRSAMIARIKIMCDLDISERRKPQDGKINFARFMPQHKIELRVATIPTNNGMEDVVMRILASAKPLPLDKIGLSPWNLAKLQEAMQRPYGMILCVGPTGSGKTTTLHSALSFINVPERKIWTAEDPVEITQPGLRQVQVNAKIDWTFAKALRAFLRADPDVIMVGEMRDTETAGMGIEASLTGHLVLSTLHTNNAPETVTRLLDMGMDPFNFADSLLVVLAQRLVKRLCTQCRVAEPAPEEYVNELLDDFLHVCPKDHPLFEREPLKADWISRFGRDGQLMKYSKGGCPQCNQTGYRGRAGVHELMAVTRELRRLIQTGARAEELQAQAMIDGMRTLRQDGIEKVLAGTTSMEEVRATSNV
ncbi:MAG TPA: ATPase, T2SS/T4P/T4SS family [Aquabacterium sp.]|uniref:GspE/PulE family protein n=1 Tax=Aquabacterium sp. TaxID=1872578 RepID=UPI002E332BCD|nr:ATPase, T2SS/T4P/T4SS family [Aquabacterium sp.]HEX5371212.1 ATPase, T2SS/T4P/T4SS family [Aquabacterium sp.]